MLIIMEVVCIIDQVINHKVIECTLPEGIGTNFTVNLTVDHQESINSTFFSYHEPIIK